MSIGSRFLSRLQRHNPFYLLSAACMLGGCLALTNSLSWTSIPLTRLIVLIVTLNLYEAMLIALAFYLLRHRGIRHDGTMLLALEAFFLTDITFLSAELVTGHFTLGVIACVILFIAAVVKLWFIGSMMDLPHRGPYLGMIALLAALFAVPMLFRWFDYTALSSLDFYITWWGIGLLVPLIQAVCGIGPYVALTSWSRWMARLYLTLPWLSLVLHMGIMHYVYNESYYAAEAAPMLLALAYVLHRAQPIWMMPRRDLVILKTMLTAVAVLVSLGDQHVLCFSLFPHSGWWITPSRLAGAMAYVTYVYFFFAGYAAYFLSAGAAAVLLMVYGPTSDQCLRFYNWTSQFFWRLAPKTALAWGINAILAAFAFLGIGASISLARRKEPNGQ